MPLISFLRVIIKRMTPKIQSPEEESFNVSLEKYLKRLKMPVVRKEIRLLEKQQNQCQGARGQPGL